MLFGEILENPSSKFGASIGNLSPGVSFRSGEGTTSGLSWFQKVEVLVCLSGEENGA